MGQSTPVEFQFRPSVTEGTFIAASIPPNPPFDIKIEVEGRNAYIKNITSITPIGIGRMFAFTAL